MQLANTAFLIMAELDPVVGRGVKPFLHERKIGHVLLDRAGPIP